MTTYKFLDREVPVHIGFLTAHKVLPDLGIEILNMGDEEKINRVLMTIVLDQECMLNVWWYYVKQVFVEDETDHKHVDEVYIECLENLKTLEPFRDVFWASIVNFSPAPLREQLKGGLTTARRELKKLANES